jgi:uncharacterized membrane protein YvbJ
MKTDKKENSQSSLGRNIMRDRKEIMHEVVVAICMIVYVCICLIVRGFV